ncbi:hypothetical protein [Williamsia sp. CHRR-6]|uniref:hypothetical protein n=1 Tax=Williamsia sp. CHRR-6 TaxID=2835871 RepID=UPI001BD9C05C|nr:hypothetical protein [Williamsia sp. CHRR-6]MBT0566497.1 hypothetical protein [Williamsia sp. CHRR-6]
MKRSCVSVVVTTSVMLSAAGLLAGCSSDSSGSAADPTSAASTSAAQTSSGTADSGGSSALDKYLLTASDLPGGFTSMSVPADQRAQAVRSAFGDAKNTVITPARCQPDLRGATPPAEGSYATSFFSNTDTGELVTTVATTGTSLVRQYKTYNSGACATHRARVTTDGQAVDVTVTYTPLPITPAGVDESFVAKQSLRSAVAGQTSSNATLVALLRKGSTTVQVTARKFATDGSAPDVASFTALVRTAAKKLTAA